MQCKLDDPETDITFKSTLVTKAGLPKYFTKSV